ncbi:hypothetical protein FDP41_009534 [Naegleria fowleri]|uniref:F-box domain-containing protein n=1 Tax=Naegleria fowleri TaxID=5763 RepID=A0A6A5BC11_NAEFO|nr:uncharacterized protein FDP41_009534 [Naegleria fowleri]KAF0972226.1 hypothetical protein FDP41_009534 [Naegleria fowleri]CAG4711404.1 unnamed protein product [Naegleria fowleri]
MKKEDFSPVLKKKKQFHPSEVDDHLALENKSETITSPKESEHRSILLASDTLIWIGSYLDVLDIIRSMSRVCKFWNDVCWGDALWKGLFQRELGEVDWFMDKLNKNLQNAKYDDDLPRPITYKICPMKSFRSLWNKDKDCSNSDKLSYKIITEDHPHFIDYEHRPGYDTDSDEEEERISKSSTLKRKNPKKETKNSFAKKRTEPQQVVEMLSLGMVQQVLEDCFGEDRFWMSLFKLVVSMIPLQNYKMMTEKQIIQPLQNVESVPKDSGVREIDDYDSNKDNDEEEEDEQESSQLSSPNEFFQKDHVFKGHHDEESWHNLISKNYCYFTVLLNEMVTRIESSEVEHASLFRKALYLDIKTHKLAVILSIFDRHGLILRYFGRDHDTTQNYLTKIDDQLAIHVQNVINYNHFQKKLPALPRTPYIAECDQMCVGVKSCYHLITVLKFCFYVLCEKEDFIYQPNLGLKQQEKDTALMMKDQQSVLQNNIYDDQLIDTKLPLEKNVAVGPLTQDAFMPFCKYLLMDRPVFDRYSYGVSRVSVKMDGQRQVAHFASGKPGWCCGFWNANFYWYHTARFETLLGMECDENAHSILRVEQDQSNILHNLC